MVIGGKGGRRVNPFGLVINPCGVFKSRELLLANWEVGYFSTLTTTLPPPSLSIK